MSKKATTTRNKAQRNKPKVQKSFELVRTERVETEVEEESNTPLVEEEGGIALAEEKGGTSLVEEDNGTSLARTSTVDGQGPASSSREKGSASSLREKGSVSSRREKVQASPLREDTQTRAHTEGEVSPLREDARGKIEERQSTPTQGSASARLAARRLAAQRLQQRSAATLITSEHFAYVRQDLIKIAVFAVLMFTAIVVLYFTLGRP